MRPSSFAAAALFASALLSTLPIHAQSVVVDLSTTPAVGDSDPVGFHTLGGKTIFTTFNDGQEFLWSSDGTPAGTVLIKSFATSFLGTPNPNFAELSGELFFWASDFTNGFELWKTDGTTVVAVR